MRSIKYKIRDKEYFRDCFAKSGASQKEAENILIDLPDTNIDYTLFGEAGSGTYGYELTTPEGEQLNIDDMNGYVRCVVLRECIRHFETGFGDIHGTFEILHEPKEDT